MTSNCANRFGIVALAVLMSSCGGSSAISELTTTPVSLGTVGADGGKLCAGPVCVEFPAGAVSQDIEVTAKVVDPGEAQADFSFLGKAYEFDADVEHFDQPVTLTLPLPSGLTDQVNLAVASRPDSSEPFFPNLSVHVSQSGVTVATTHFSQWTVIQLPHGGTTYGIAAYGDGIIATVAQEFFDFQGIPTLKNESHLIAYKDASDTTGTTFMPSESQESEFETPFGIAVGPDGKLYMAAVNSQNLVRVDDLTGAGWLGFGRDLGNPGSVAVGPDGKIYMANEGSVSTELFRMDDTSGAGLVRFGSYGNGEKQFARIYSVTLGPDGKIYMADVENYRIVRMDDMSGAGWITLGSKGSGEKQFSSPYDVRVGKDGTIYVADRFNDRIVQMDDMTGAGWKTYPAPSVKRLAVSNDGTRLFYLAGNRIDSIAISVSCPTGQTGCSGTCVDLQKDAANCGACGTACSGGQVCDAGQCAAPDGCPTDPNKTEPGECGCGVTEDTGDDDADGLINCKDASPQVACPCFKFADVTRRKAQAGYMCYLDEMEMTASEEYGVVKDYGNGLSDGVLNGFETTEMAYVCASGCQDSNMGADCDSQGLSPFMLTDSITQAQAQACSDLITAACQ